MTEVSVVTNSFFITRLPTKDFLQYDVGEHIRLVPFVVAQLRLPAFRPDIEIPNKRERAMHMVQNTVAPNVFHPRGVYDGKSLLYLSHRLNLPGGGGAASFTVRLGNDPNAPVGAPGVYEVIISKTASEIIRPSDVNRLIAAPGQTIDRKAATAMNLLQLLIRQSSNQNHPTNNGRAYFSPAGKKSLLDGIELWRGFYQSVRPTIGRMIVTIDTSMAAVYESGPLHEVAMSVLGVRSTRDLTFDDNHVKFRKLQAHFKNRLIKTRTTGEKTKTIRAIVPGPIGRYTFLKDGRTTTIQEHFRAAYNITLQHPGTFGVQISSRPFPVIIPAELCFVLPGQLYKKRLPPLATAAAVDFATQRPQDRMKTITGGTNAGVQSPIQEYGHSEFVYDAGMMIDSKPITLKAAVSFPHYFLSTNTFLVQAKLLAHPRLEFHGSDLMPNNGAWNAVNRTFINAMRLSSWAVANFDSRISPNLIQRVIHDLMAACRAVGMSIESPTEVRSGDGHSPAKTLDAIGNAMGGKIELVIVLLPSKADEIRNKVKHWGDVVRGVKTSCLREDKLQRANNQYWTNVAISGQYAVPKNTIIPQLKSSPFMIFGADVAHPGPGASRPSIASVVFSWNTAATNYAAYSEVQAPRQEIIPGLKGMVKKAILTFGEKNPPPARIIFYRDGVSEGEMETVKMTEISAIRNACIEVWKERKMKVDLPTITFICVVKRHHTIFLPNEPRVEDGKTGNCLAGLVVDQLRSPLALDFYLQSHAAIKGTSRSGHYSILLDENFNNNVSTQVILFSKFHFIDVNPRIQQLSFELCHVYAKATRSISIPAPVYYADMVCSRAKFHVDPDSMEYDASTNNSGSEAFDLEYWRAAYKPASRASHYDKTMYFL
ncbi:ribonuclease H-like domain-containing protein [Mycena haematopus]|nr:ribonuclease H-like domain-containing protein [Mycena haematopus]